MDQRASDLDREHVADQLREHYAAGRLTDEDLDKRVQAAYAAQTDNDLQRLTADLPMLPAVRAQRERAELVERRAHLQRRLVQQAGGGVIAFLVCTAIWAASGASGQFWPIWVALVALIPLLKNGWDLYGPSPQLDRVEAELDRNEKGDQTRRDRRSERDEARRDRPSDRDEARRDRRAARDERRGRIR
jgi:hypothetical protein